MATCDAVKISCEDEEDKKISSKRHSPLDNGNFVNNDTTSESCLVTLETDVVLCPPDFEPKLSRREKKKRKRMQRQIPNLLTDNDAPISIHVDTSTAKDDSIGKNSCDDSLVGINANTDSEFAAEPVLIRSKRKLDNGNFVNNDTTSESCLVTLETDVVLGPSDFEPRISQGKKKKRKRMQRQIPNLLTDNDAPINIHVDTSTAKDDSIGKNSCDDCLVGVNAKTDSEFAAEPVLIKSKRKRKRKRKKFNSSGITNEVNVSLADLPGTEESALVSEKQSESPRSPSASMVNTHNGEADLSLGEKDNIKTRRKRKHKKKHNTSVINDNAHHSHADLDLVGMERNGLLSETQSKTKSPSVDVVEKQDNNGDAAALIPDGNANIKKKRKRDKQKLKNSLITDKAHVPPADLDTIEMDQNASISEKQIDSSRSPSSTVSKNAHNDPAAFVSDKKKKKQKLETSVITDKVHVPLAELDRSGEENALIHIKESCSCSTSSSNQGAVCISVQKEITKTNHIEGKIGSRRRRKRKSSNAERNMQPTTVAIPESTDIIEIKKSPPVVYGDKKLLILDVNGLLADIVPHSECERKADIVISRKSVFRRPFCDDFLQFCFEKFNVGIWSSRIKRNLDMVVDFLMADSRHKLLFCWDQSHCTESGFTTPGNWSKPLVLKELKKLWGKLRPGLPWNKGDYNESNTLLLDDSPCKALRNPANTAIFPFSYTHKDAGDSSLGPGGDLRVYLEKLAEGQNVQEFVAHNPFGQPAITESHPKWGFYRKIALL